MAKIEFLEPGKMALIQQSKDGRIMQIGLTPLQSDLLQIYLGVLSRDSKLVQMGKEHDLILKSSATVKR